jgi:hypothetical protein
MTASLGAALLAFVPLFLWGPALGAPQGEGAARGVIFLVDLNHSSLELRAAREAAARRGDELVVLPNIPDPLRLEYEQKKRDLQTLETRLIAMGSPRPTNATEHARVKEQVRQLRSIIQRYRRDHEVTH